MGYIYSGSNTTSPIGKVMDYNNTNPSSSVAIYRTLASAHNPLTFTPVDSGSQTNFARAIYGEGPYSLLHPNYTNDYLANNIDMLA